MKKITITKTGMQNGGELSTFNSVGEIKSGYIEIEPQVGSRFIIWNSDIGPIHDCWSTSGVTEIIDSNNFNTIYSKYNWKYEAN